VRAAIGTLLAFMALAVAGCGQQQQHRAPPATSAAQTPVAPAVVQAHPQAIEPVAGAAPSAPGPAAPSEVSVDTGSAALPQPVSDAQIRRELAASGLSPDPGQATLAPDGLAIPPIDAPAAVQEVIQAGNEIAHLPYRYGGGHLTYEDSAYDCSGSISFVFAAAHLLNATVVSGQLMNWGDPGPGKWITVFANRGHTFMYVAGLRFDTVALAETGSRWSNRAADEPDLRTFAIRHPQGL
jgi:cell wall-associated NlpC family hydrolase